MIRIVRMTFREEAVDSFLNIFDESCNKITQMPGCRKVELLHDIDDPTTFITISEWTSREHLDQYRSSDVFANVWREVKALFAERPSAWSLEHMHR